MTDTAQGYPGEQLQLTKRSTLQPGTPEGFAHSRLPRQHDDTIEDALEPHTNQLTDRAHNISTRRVLTK